MKIHRISFLILVLAVSTLTCNLPGRAARPQTSPPSGAATSVIPGLPEPLTVPSDVPGVQASSIPAPRPAVLEAKHFAMLNSLLALKIAVLNTTELKFIRHLQAVSGGGRPAGFASAPQQTGSNLADEDLKDLAGQAMEVAIMSDQLRELSVRQDNGSQPAAQAADQYAAIARTAFSLVIDAQNIRTALQNHLMPGSAAIEVIAGYGAQLWNVSVTDGKIGGSPFMGLAKNSEPVQTLNPNAAAQAQSQISAGNSSIWIAQSAAQTSKALNLPAAQLPVADPFDPLVLGWLATTEGQSDGNQAQQVAAANLQRLGATTSSSDPAKPMQLQVPVNPVAVAGAEQIQAGNLPSFKQGTATAVSKNSPGEENAFMQNWGLTGEEKPSDQGKMTVQDKPELVNLTISRVVIDSIGPDFELEGAREVSYHFMVTWSTTLAAPQFTIHCKNGMPVGDYITSRSGSLTEYEEGVTSADRILVTCVAVRGWGFGPQTTLGGDSLYIYAHGKHPTVTPTLEATLTQTPPPIATTTPTAARMRTPTPTATQAPFTLNGTFSINWAHGYYTGGFIHLTVDPLSGQVSGSIDGSGTYSGEDKSCPPDTDPSKLKYTSTRTFRGNLAGTVDLKTGVLSLAQAQEGMTGTISTSGGCSDPMTMNLPPAFTLDGTVDLANHTAKGRIFSARDYDPGEGDWHAGE